MTWLHVNMQLKFRLLFDCRTPGTLLYDPALRRTLLSLMKKLYVQLTTEFKKYGATVIYGDFNRVVLSTNKSNVSDAVANVQYVLTTVRKKELFHSIGFRILKVGLFLFTVKNSQFLCKNFEQCVFFVLKGLGVSDLVRSQQLRRGQVRHRSLYQSFGTAGES